MIRFAPIAAIFLLAGTSAHAECKRMAFSVNDYGKVGPARDAQALLDKAAAKWAASRGGGKVSVGPKTVSCKLFLDFIVFDEYTCTAEANVCTGGGNRGPRRASSASPAEIEDAPKPSRAMMATRPTDSAASR